MADEEVALFQNFKEFLEEGCDSSVLAACDPVDLNVIFKVAAHGATLPSPRHTYYEFLKLSPSGRELRSISQLINISSLLIYTILHTEWPHAIPSAIVAILETIAGVLAHANTISNLSSENYEKIVKIAVMTEPYCTEPYFLEAPFHIRIQLFPKLFAVFKILSKRSDLMTETITKYLRQLVQRDGRDSSGQNMLLLSCDPLSLIHTRLIVSFLLKLGANPYARNNEGNGVFHILAITGDINWNQPDLRDDVARCILNFTHGHGIDLVNDEGMTAADLWFQKYTPGTRNVADLPDWLQEEPKPNPLKCLAATVIRRQKINFQEKDLPAELIDFVSKH